MGSVVQNVNPITLAAGEALTAADIGRGGVLNASNQVVGAGAGVYPHVIIREIQATVGNGVKCHHVASSMRLSITLAGTVVAGDPLVTDANGDFVVGTSGDKYCLVAEVGGATGEYVTALVVPADTVA